MRRGSSFKCGMIVVASSEEILTNEQNINIGGTGYNRSDLSDQAKVQLQNIGFCDQEIQQLKSEWAIADTARLAYTNALKSELKKLKG